MAEELRQIPLAELLPDPKQPRTHFNPDALQELAASLLARGVLQPLRVLPDAERACYLIVTGESRYRAAKLVGLATLPCLVMQDQPDEADLLADRIVENVCRKDLSVIDYARALARLKTLKGGITSQRLAAELGISNASITRSEAILGLPEAVLRLVEDGKISGSAAYELSRYPEPEAQLRMAHEIAAGRMSRDMVAEAVQRRIGKKKTAEKASRLTCRMESGISLSFSSQQPCDWDSLLATIDKVRSEARKLKESGKEPAALARAFRA